MSRQRYRDLRLTSASPDHYEENHILSWEITDGLIETPETSRCNFSRANSLAAPPWNILIKMQLCDAFMQISPINDIIAQCKSRQVQVRQFCIFFFSKYIRKNKTRVRISVHKRYARDA